MHKFLDEYLKKSQLSDESLAVGCSGGVDSMVLLDSLIKIHPKGKIYCLHLDHGWREDSKDCINFLEEYCKRNGIRFLYKSYKLGEMKVDENTARESRYKFFTEACEVINSKNLLLAHNFDDDVETITFRLIRGTSSSGLTGIPSSRLLNDKIQLHRPFLEIEKKEIQKFAEKEGIEFKEDLSNLDTNYARNLIRIEILPLLEKINPSVKDNISSLSKIIEEENEYLEEQAKKALENLGDLAWDLEDLRKLPKAILRRVLEKTFTPNIRFCNEFMEAIHDGGFHKINYSKGKFFAIRKKQINLEYN